MAGAAHRLILAPPPNAKDLEDERRFVGDLANIGTPLYREFNKRFRKALLDRYQSGDIVCLPFGEAHKEAVDNLEVLAVETGIGYPDSSLPFRIREPCMEALDMRTMRRRAPQLLVRLPELLRHPRVTCQADRGILGAHLRH